MVRCPGSDGAAVVLVLCLGWVKDVKARQGPWGRSSWSSPPGCSWKSEMGAEAACPAASPDDVPMSRVPQQGG